jgi:5-methylcytosine-specific restriction endonuclease McrA
LTAHHVKPWSKYPKDRFKVNNGEALCVDCHQRLEKERRSEKNGKKIKMESLDRGRH